METVKVIAEGHRGWKIINKQDMLETDKIYSEQIADGEKPKAKRKAKSKEA